MLRSFSVKNYKSFREENIFSLIKKAKHTDLSYSVFDNKLGKKNLSTLCSSVIYGPNAAGKTNIISAMDTFRSMVIRGNIHNSEQTISSNVAATSLELVPNIESKMEDENIFKIEFLFDNILYNYELILKLGGFLNTKFDRKIISEKLFINNELLFDRGDDLTFGIAFKNKKISNKLNIDVMDEKIIKLLFSGLNNKDLFLTHGFKALVSPILASKFMEWITDKFVVIYDASSIKLLRKFENPDNKTIYVEKTLEKAAKIFGVSGNNLGYTVDNDESAVLCSLIKSKDAVIPAKFFESYGTYRFINVFPLVLKALKEGSTLVIDEFDASLHPMALMNIINIFHNDDININHAQLIFDTHNPIFLNADLFRRDEIKLVERNSDNSSEIYTLADFGTDKNGVRKGEDYMSNYFVNKYGAINEVDFSDLVEDIIKGKIYEYEEDDM